MITERSWKQGEYEVTEYSYNEYAREEPGDVPITELVISSPDNAFEYVYHVFETHVAMLLVTIDENENHHTDPNVLCL